MLKNLFIQMFRDGHSDPSKRPTLKDFTVALNAYKAGLNQGYHCLELMPVYAKSSQYNGTTKKIA
jgi:hypothetical protein